ncbi:MAG: nucleotidyltransferase family protein [Xanthomonadales bacterium]|nr:nucleotidyltransferase family protein [Xanthomonadales bacterium]
MPDPRLPRHGAIILAAGRSQRLGQSKQLLRIDGESLVHRATRFSLASKPLECLVVSRADDSEIALALGDLPCRIVPCADAADGLSASLRCGLLALDPRCDGALIVLTDQPAISAAHLAALCVRWRGDPGCATASAYSETIGVPAILPRAWFASLIANTHDHGARDLLRSRREQVHSIAAEHLALDVDTPDDLARINIGPT